jgi:endonuclease YncB( thermonuclease family)
MTPLARRPRRKPPSAPPAALRPSARAARRAGLALLLACGLWALGPAAGPAPHAPWGVATAWAHPGSLDAFGGHYDERTHTYHYHKPSRDMAQRKPEWLEWTRFPVRGTIKGQVVAVDPSDEVWVFVEYRPAYQELADKLAMANRDDKTARLRIALAHVSTRETGARNPRFEDWFLRKVAAELKTKLLEKAVRVEFELVGVGSAGTLRGTVFLEEENVNLWLVENGWSYYVLSDGENPYDALFRTAEDTAKRNQAGIWQYIR